MLSAANELTKCAQEVVATNDGALKVDPSGARYADLGCVIDATDVAANAFVYSAWMDNVQWVRNVIITYSGSKTHNAGIFRRDSELVDAGGTTYVSDQASVSGVRGYCARLFLKNQDPSATADLTMRAQLLG